MSLISTSIFIVKDFESNSLRDNPSTAASDLLRRRRQIFVVACVIAQKGLEAVVREVVCSWELHLGFGLSCMVAELLSGASELLPAYGTVRCFIIRTAEAEVVAYNEACQCGESTGALLEVLGYGGVRKHMQGDSKSGISPLTADTGAWRTRHLRLWSAKLRKVIQDPAEPWTVGGAR